MALKKIKKKFSTKFGQNNGLKIFLAVKPAEDIEADFHVY